MLGDIVTYLISVSVINWELEELVNDGLNYKDPKVTKFLLVNPGNWLRGCKLSNYGEALKLMLPSYIRKDVSGWSNYSGMVTRYEMDESKMGNRVSKSSPDFREGKRATSRR